MTVSDIVSTIGVSLILIAYFCSTFRWMSAHGRPFFLLNAVGSTLTCLGSFLIAYWPFVALEGTWTIVSLIGLIKAEK
jgi:hypothetical protein